MSKAKNKSDKRQVKPQPQSLTDEGRRRFLALGLGGFGTLALAGATGVIGYRAGWFGSNPAPTASPAPVAPTPNLATGKSLPPVTLPADAPNALRAAEDFVSHYARELNNPSVLIHAVRAFGKNFKLNDGTKAVDHLCSKYAAEREVNNKRYVYFELEAEVHENSFLKTLLEAGVSPDQPVTVGNNKYTLRDLGESAKSLFRCDPQNLQRYDPTLIHMHLPWGLIAFSILVPPSKSTWVNAYGETINLPEVINSGLAAFEGSCSGVGEIIAHGEDEPLPFRQEMAKYSCAGMHMYYGFFSCLKHGYREHDLQQRLQRLLDSLILRLQGDSEAIKRETVIAHQYGQEYVKGIGVTKDGRSTTRGNPPPGVIDVMSLRHMIKAVGHALEAINYVQLHHLFNLTAEQKKRVQAGEQVLYEYLVKLRAVDMAPYMYWHDKFVSDTLIAVAHAVRAMKLLTRENPDTIAFFRPDGQIFES